LNTDYFLNAENHERHRITVIFENYFKHRNCSYLNLTSTQDFNSCDAFFVSASTDTSVCVVIEYKHRLSYDFLTFNSGLMEFSKYKCLYEFWRANAQVFYINEFRCGHIAVIDMNKVFKDRSMASLEHYFYSQHMVANSSGNSGTKEKLVTQIDYNVNTYVVLDPDFKPSTYKEAVDKIFSK
jgi:hypothetical protein